MSSSAKTCPREVQTYTLDEAIKAAIEKAAARASMAKFFMVEVESG
jgi:hypothetical protein